MTDEEAIQIVSDRVGIPIERMLRCSVYQKRDDLLDKRGEFQLQYDHIEVIFFIKAEDAYFLYGTWFDYDDREPRISTSMERNFSHPEIKAKFSVQISDEERDKEIEKYMQIQTFVRQAQELLDEWSDEDGLP